MAIERWSSSATIPKPGWALFDTGPSAARSYHAMIIRSVSTSAIEGVKVEVAHMGPPLDLRDPEQKALTGDDWVGWIPERTDEEYQMLLGELERLERQVTPNPVGNNGYDLGVHTISYSTTDGESNGVVIHASCASLLEHCYESIEVDLVDEDEVPQITIDELAQIVGKRPEVLQRVFDSMGTHVEWPCAVLLPAYQMRAFDAGLSSCPWKAKVTDHPFPDGDDQTEGG